MKKNGKSLIVFREMWKLQMEWLNDNNYNSSVLLNNVKRGYFFVGALKSPPFKVSD